MGACEYIKESSSKIKAGTFLEFERLSAWY
jgi:hypothetical protein